MRLHPKSDPVRVRRDASRPHGGVREARQHAHVPSADARRRSRSQRAHAGLSAEHRRRLGNPRDRRVAGGARLDEQHVPSADRPELQQLDELRRDRRAPGRHASVRPPSAPARKSPRSSGSQRGATFPRSRGRWWTSGSFFSRRGILLNYDIPGQPDRANSFGVDYLRVTLDPASGWTNVPTSFSPAQQERLTVTTTFAAVNPTRLYDLYIYDSTDDSTVNYDHVLVVPASTKNGALAVADLSQNQWADVKVTLIGRARARPRASAKAIDLAPDLSRFRLYFTSVTRVNATYNALGSAGSAAFEETLAHDFPTSMAADFAPLEGGIVDEDTYAEQGLKWQDAHFAYLHYIFDDARPRARPAPPRHPDHGRVPAPVHGARHDEGHRQRSQPVLRRRRGRRHRGRPRREPRGLHPRRPITRPTRRLRWAAS